MSSYSKHVPGTLSRVSLKVIDSRLPGNIVLCDDGSVRELLENGHDPILEPSYNENGKPFLEFVGSGDPPTYTVWLSNAMFRAHCGFVPKEEEVHHIDGDRRNLHPANLRLAKKGSTEYRLVRRRRSGPPKPRGFLDS